MFTTCVCACIYCQTRGGARPRHVVAACMCGRLTSNERGRNADMAAWRWLLGGRRGKRGWRCQSPRHYRVRLLSEERRRERASALRGAWAAYAWRGWRASQPASGVVSCVCPALVRSHPLLCCCLSSMLVHSSAAWCLGLLALGCGGLRQALLWLARLGLVRRALRAAGAGCACRSLPHAHVHAQRAASATVALRSLALGGAAQVRAAWRLWPHACIMHTWPMRWGGETGGESLVASRLAGAEPQGPQPSSKSRPWARSRHNPSATRH